MKSRRFLIALLTLSAIQTVAAQVPHQFEANTPAVATEVNENFQHLVDEINQVDSNLEALGNEVETAESQINANISALQSVQMGNSAAIQSNASLISAHRNEIDAVETSAGNNASAISSNDIDIANNAANISANNTNIANNATGISSNDTDIANLASDISDINTQMTTLEDSIDTHTTDIGTLETDVGSLETQVSGLSQSPTAAFESFNKYHHDDFTYSAKSGTVGQEITVNSLTFRIVEFSFKELGSGDEYTVKLPYLCGATCSDPTSITLTTSHVLASGTGNISIDGYPAFIQKTYENHDFRVFTNTSSNQYIKSILTRIYIRVDETLLSFALNVSTATVGNAAGTSDFTSVFDLNDVSDATGMIGYVDDAIDYIDIEPVTP